MMGNDHVVGPAVVVLVVASKGVGPKEVYEDGHNDEELSDAAQGTIPDGKKKHQEHGEVEAEAIAKLYPTRVLVEENWHHDKGHRGPHGRKHWPPAFGPEQRQK